MKKIILTTWLIVILISSGLLAISIVYEIDEFQGMVNFQFHIESINVIKNSTSNITNLEVTANIFNPSSFSNYELRKINNIIFLNGEEPEYLRGNKWFFKILKPQERINITWSYEVVLKDLNLLNRAEIEGNWNWYFYIQISLISNIIESLTFDRSQSFQGVEIIIKG